MKWFSIYFSVNDVCKLDLNNTLGLETLGLSPRTTNNKHGRSKRAAGIPSNFHVVCPNPLNPGISSRCNLLNVVTASSVSLDLSFLG